MESRKVHVVSLGCPKARVDTEVMVGLAKQGGWELSEEAEGADALVVNTCSFLQSAVKESIDTILELAEYKKARPGTKLIVTGCLPSRYGAEVVDELGEVDTFLGTSDLHRIGEALSGVLPDRSYIQHGYSHLYEGIDDTRVNSTRGATAFLKLAEGCNRTCTFCIIPAIRGRQRSRPIPVVVEEAKRLVNLGIREIVLVAQDLTSYGTDLKDKDSLVKLLRELEAIPELRWIRLMYAYPWNFTDELLELIRTSSKVLRYVDMPLQHVSEHILQDMRRNVQRDAQKRLLGRLREIEGMVIRTTLISGFPGETDADHRELVDWVREVQFDRVGVFAYSQEPGTPAGERKDQVPKRVREARRKEILAVQQEIHAAKMEAMIGRQVEVLVDGVSEEHGWVLEGRYYGQAPDIDGVVVLSMEDPDVEVAPGRFVQATITAASEYDLVGAVGGGA